jgi:hypothetical protein
MVDPVLLATASLVEKAVEVAVQHYYLAAQVLLAQVAQAVKVAVVVGVGGQH